MGREPGENRYSDRGRLARSHRVQCSSRCSSRPARIVNHCVFRSYCDVDIIIIHILYVYIIFCKPCRGVVSSSISIARKNQKTHPYGRWRNRKKTAGVAVDTYLCSSLSQVSWTENQTVLFSDTAVCFEILDHFVRTPGSGITSHAVWYLLQIGYVLKFSKLFP